jgi:hypothetical protein
MHRSLVHTSLREESATAVVRTCFSDRAKRQSVIQSDAGRVICDVLPASSSSAFCSSVRTDQRSHVSIGDLGSLVLMNFISRSWSGMLKRKRSRLRSCFPNTSLKSG